MRDTHKEWVKIKSKLSVRRGFLIILLGGKCRECSSTEKLELDHVFGKTWSARKLSPKMRMKRYEEDYDNGNLSLLCRSCNGTDGATNQKFYSAIRNGETPEVEKVPF